MRTTRLSGPKSSLLSTAYQASYFRPYPARQLSTVNVHEPVSSSPRRPINTVGHPYPSTFGIYSLTSPDSSWTRGSANYQQGVKHTSNPKALHLFGHPQLRERAHNTVGHRCSSFPYSLLSSSSKGRTSRFLLYRLSEFCEEGFLIIWKKS
jgi:hypothetical protein